MDMFKNACRLATCHTVARYLMSNADGRWDGAEKATRHMELCAFYTCVALGIHDQDLVRRTDDGEALFDAIHAATQEMTDSMDETIGFPLKGRPDYDTLIPAFFEEFHRLAMAAVTEFRLPSETQKARTAALCDEGFNDLTPGE